MTIKKNKTKKTPTNEQTSETKQKQTNGKNIAPPKS